jgi:hypothetical protein
MTDGADLAGYGLNVAQLECVLGLPPGVASHPRVDEAARRLALQRGICLPARRSGLLPNRSHPAP